VKKVIIAVISVVLIAVAVIAVVKFTEKRKYDTALETAETVINVSNEMGTVAVNERIAVEMLGRYPLEKFGGLTQPLNKYIVKLSAVRVLDSDACKVEFFLNESDEEPVATYAILGYDCFLYDKETGKYLLLTMNGAFEVEGTTKIHPDSNIFYDVENNKSLHKLIDKFSAESLGFPKEPSEFVMVATGGTAVADDGKTVYIVKMYEQDGTVTNYTCAFERMCRWVG
jgi:hypothetical protein